MGDKTVTLILDLGLSISGFRGFFFFKSENNINWMTLALLFLNCLENNNMPATSDYLYIS